MINMNRQKCILIDDEAHALGNLAEIIDKIPSLEIQGKYFSIPDALEGLKKNGEVDFIFSDIEMPDFSGIEAAKLLRRYCRYIIYTTAYDHYAFEAFKEDADGFLLKPITLHDVLAKIENIRKKEESTKKSYQVPASLFVKAGKKNTYIRIAYQDIICIDAGDHYPTIITMNERHSIYMSMRELDDHLKTKGDFVRIHKSCIISIGKLKKIDGNVVYLDLKDHNRREIGETYRKAFFEYVAEHSLISTK